MNQKLPPILDFLATLTPSTTKVDDNEKTPISDNTSTGTVPVLTESQTLGTLFSAHPEELIYEPAASDIHTEKNIEKPVPVQSLFLSRMMIGKFKNINERHQASSKGKVYSSEDKSR